MKQTEEYALTEQETISIEMTGLTDKLSISEQGNDNAFEDFLKGFEKDLEDLKSQKVILDSVDREKILSDLNQRLNMLKLMHAQ